MQSPGGIYTANVITPIIAQQPLSQSVVVGTNATLNVAATGSSLYYQWFKNGAVIANATQAALAFNPVALSDAGNYSVVVSNTAGSVTSSNAVLAVRLPGAPIIRVDNQLVVGGVTRVFPATATVTMASGFANGIIYYTLDGSAPDFGSAVYSVPVIVSNTAVVRALGLNVDTFDTAEAPAVTVNILPTYGLTITTSGHGTFETVPSSGPFASNTVVSVAATPTCGWVFDHWSGDASGSANPLSVTMDRARSVQAVFAQLFPVTATTLGGGSVGVTPAQASYLSNSVVSIGATASNGWTFLRWSGDASGTNNPLSLTVNAPKNLAAVFGTTVGTSVIGSGVVELNATNPVAYGTLVRATAIPNNGSYFTQWGSAVTGTNSPAEFAVVSTNPVRAVFATLQAGQAALSLRIIGAGSVAVTPRQQVYTVGDSVTLTATPQGTTNQFNGWSGDAVSAANPLVLTLNTSKVVTANFTPAFLALGITQQGGNVVLSWPVTYSNSVLLGSAALTGGAWTTNTSPRTVSGNNITVTLPAANSRMFFRVRDVAQTDNPASTNMALIPAGSFTMGSAFNDWPADWGANPEIPLHSVYVSAFYMDRYDVTKALWDEVYNWATNHGYSFACGDSVLGKAATHPAQNMTWNDAAKWCNARSEKEGRMPAYYTSAAQTTVYRGGETDVQNDWVKWSAGYRLPTEAEWEKAARGGASGQRFPWGNTISWSEANYFAWPGYAYDVNPTSTFGNPPAFDDGVYPYTSPVDYFAPNGYGLYDMAGNVSQWCWDWYEVYSSSSQNDPRGPTSGSFRVFRGGGWDYFAIYCRSAYRVGSDPTYRAYDLGFRSVLPPGQ